MKFSSAAMTIAAISLLSTTHAVPLAFKNGEITGRLHYRRASHISDISSASTANKAMEDLDIGFEPEASLLLPRILNLFKRQSSSSAAISTSTSPSVGSTSHGTSSGTTGTNLHTAVMTPDYESYGFASEGGVESALAPVREVKE